MRDAAANYAAHAEERRADYNAWAATHREEVRARSNARYATHREEKAVYAVAHREERRARAVARRVENAAWMRNYRAEHPEQFQTYHRTYAVLHPEKDKAHRRRRREALAKVPPYPRMNPWPSDCQCCGESIDPTRRHPDPLAGSEGHEPPIDWLSRHPEWEGPLILRPEHLRCNLAKHARPDWELPVDKTRSIA